MSDFFLGALAVLLFLLSLFLVFIIMIQRGKGGGIAGSLTGTAQSAFGARGGDLLMWVTIALTGVWIFLSGITIYVYSSPKDGAEADEEGGVTEIDTQLNQNAEPSKSSSNPSVNATDVGEEPSQESTPSDTESEVSTNDANNGADTSEPLVDETEDEGDATPVEDTDQ
ncbi:MAG: preprotein translocase subunit SecG [Pirellulales bacterium]|nr:preprotein translocase subunit SecG [Pirellulales bacterium]